MSGFFSLGGKENEQEQGSTNNLFSFRNEEICNKGFELWEEYCNVNQQRLQHDVDQLEIPVKRIVITSSGSTSSIRVGDESGFRSGFRVMRQGEASTGGGISCQDCGNQAKKDCEHLRCRTCCKGRGFQCQTHIKSTWVTAAKRRENQQQLAALQQQQHQQQQQQQLSVMMRGENPKRQRVNRGVAPCNRLPTTTTPSGLVVDGHFPAEVNSPAMFRCVRVSGVNDREDEYAYQTAVNIGGHLFKGILYDQGPDQSCYSVGGERSSRRGGAQQPLNLIASTGTSTISNPIFTMLDPSMYPVPLGAFMAGTQFFPPPRP